MLSSHFEVFMCRQSRCTMRHCRPDPVTCLPSPSPFTSCHIMLLRMVAIMFTSRFVFFVSRFIAFTSCSKHVGSFPCIETAVRGRDGGEKKTIVTQRIFVAIPLSRNGVYIFYKNDIRTQYSSCLKGFRKEGFLLVKL